LEEAVRAKVQRWGNSLAVRIPKAFAKEVGLMAESAVELTVVEGKLVIQPALAPTLAELLDGVTPENLHGEIAAGPAAGNEVW
jgi:antitoxin MazE